MHRFHYQQAIVDRASISGSLDLSRLAHIEAYVRRRGKRTRFLGDPHLMVLDVIDGRRATMDSLKAAIDVSDDRLLSKLGGIKAFEKEDTYGSRYRGGDYLKVTRRAYVVLEKYAIIRGAQNRGRWDRSRIEAAARMVGEYHVWKWMPRHLRGADRPRNLASFATGYGLTEGDVSQVLYLALYPSWSERYVPVVSSAENVAETKDILQDAIRKQEGVDPEKVNANLFKIALQANGANVGQAGVQVTVNQQSNTLNVGIDPAEMEQRKLNLGRYAARFLGGQRGSQGRAVEVSGSPADEHERENRAGEEVGGARPYEDRGVSGGVERPGAPD